MPLATKREPAILSESSQNSAVVPRNFIMLLLEQFTTHMFDPSKVRAVGFIPASKNVVWLSSYQRRSAIA
jgi:hypothetical protein